MKTLEEKIIEKITKEGPITFKTFMDMALYYPELGYYTSPETIIGREGDFYTSPHLHPIFGAMIAKQLLEMWKFMDTPPEFNAVEMGAGMGYLCKDIIGYLSRDENEAASFLQSLKYTIVEPCVHLEKQQRKVLGGLAGNVAWCRSLKELKATKGCVFSNELLDSFPVHLIEMDDSLKEIHVDFNNGKFNDEKLDISSEEIMDYINLFSINPDKGYRTEINIEIKNWLEDIAAIFSSGFILTIDYGYTAREYYSNDRTGGTLLCYYKHQYNDNPYQYIGQQDITAHLNFSSLKIWGEALGFKTLGYSPQGTFLTASGIDEIIVELYSDQPDYLSEISKIKGLIFPQGMGESHNFMIQYKGEGAPDLRGFSMRNLLTTL
jgi:SAM-dependent MidA family methyltransferase